METEWKWNGKKYDISSGRKIELNVMEKEWKVNANKMKMKWI